MINSSDKEKDPSTAKQRRRTSAQDPLPSAASESEKTDSKRQSKLTMQRIRLLRNGMIVALLLGSISFSTIGIQYMYKEKVNGDRYRVVVALSTIPSRLRLLQPTLESLIEHQLKKPDKVYLTLPKKQGYGKRKNLKYKIPSFVRNYVKQRKVMILNPEFDYGPISKVLYALEMESYDTRIIYVDDDVTYDRFLVSNLYIKAAEFEDSAIALNGATLKDYFRQIKHTNPEADQHPNLFFQTSGTDSFYGEASIDIVQGFAGVCVQRRFFDIPSLKEFVKDLPDGVRKSDDFIISAHLEWRNITRMIVSGGSMPNINPVASKIDRLSTYMHDNAMDAAYFLQQKLGIWNNKKFLNRDALSQDERDGIDCEAGHEKHCHDNFKEMIQHIEGRYAVN